jgi:hypothetical protein
MPKGQVAPVTVNVRASGHARVNVSVSAPHEQERQPLRFGHGNAKLDAGILTFSLPAGHSCPFARSCLSKSDRRDGTIRDGRHTEFRCYAASMEARHGSVRRSRWHNYEVLLACRSKEEMTRVIIDSLTPFAGYVRVHDSGDFFSQDYFGAWMDVARRRERTLFYAYTKALPYWVRCKDEVPENFMLTASYGGQHDHLIEEHSLRYARVVYSEEEAADLGLELDHDDSHAMRPGPSFALLLHGTQPQGTPAAEAAKALRDHGEFGHGYRADEIRIRLGRRPLKAAQ